jgi:cell fate regulator YaaT (PSP1 superfamily)
MTDYEELQGQSGDEPTMPNITYKPGYNKLDSFNWLKDIPDVPEGSDIVEIRFKNTRKGFYRNVNNLRLEIGDVVAVEASPGHDIGRVSMVGHLVYDQMKKLKTVPPPDDMKKVYRKAKSVDIQKWEEAKNLEVTTMLRSRQISEELSLNMKIGDVEYQGDKTKAIFYYIADERVDFRQLIKVLADEFRIRIEMRQIGARQEAGRIGGIGSCGRELCCSTHITNFVSVTTTHAKYQELTLNPQKLAGQCSKLKCCLNFELDCYVETQRSFPSKLSIVPHGF